MQNYFSELLVFRFRLNTVIIMIMLSFAFHLAGLVLWGHAPAWQVAVLLCTVLQHWQNDFMPLFTALEWIGCSCFKFSAKHVLFLLCFGSAFLSLVDLGTLVALWSDASLKSDMFQLSALKWCQKLFKNLKSSKVYGLCQVRCCAFFNLCTAAWFRNSLFLLDSEVGME